MTRFLPLSRTRALALGALALAGCASMAPRYERPAAPVADTFPQSENVPGGSAVAIDWRDFCADARLRRLVEIALANNRDLRVAMLDVETARAQLGLQRAAEFPSLSLAAGEDRVTGQPTVFSTGIAVSSWELDLWGRVRSLSAAAAAQLAATEEGRKAAQITLVASVANADVALGADDEQLDLAQRTLVTRADTLALTQLRFDHGVASDLDLQDARSLVEAARVAVASAQRQQLIDQDALVLLLGQPLPADLPAATPWRDFTLPDVPAGLPSDVLLERPDVRQAEHQLIAANADIGAARAAFFPTVTLTGSYGTASSQFDKLFDHRAFTFVPQLVLPIFDAGRNRANLNASEANRDIAVAQYEKAIQSAFRDVADALAGRATLSDQLRAQQALADAEQRRYELTSLRFEHGVASSLDLLDSQRSLFTAQQATVATRMALLQNRIALYRALGGGWTEPAAQTANAR